MWKPVSFRTELSSWVSWMKLTNKTGYVLLLKSNKKLNQNDMNLRCFSKGSQEGIWQNGITRRYFRDAPRFSWDKSGHSCFSRDAPRLSRDKSSHSRFPWHILVTLNSLEINLITLISLGMRLVFSTFSWDKSDYSRFSWDAPRFYWDTSGYSCFSQNMSNFPRNKSGYSKFFSR